MSNKDSWKAFPLIAIPILIKDCWNTVMTIEHSPLRKLDPMVAHMVFTILGFMWSAIFGIAIVESFTAFGVSAVVHIVLISGFAITAMVFNEADKRPDALNKTMEKGFKFLPGYHSSPRARQNMYVNGQKVKLDPNDPGGEHE
tara:strand:+ start:115 stop:543 length:429 start_codon:yes stop_codon:yes gene_type:complete